MNHRVADILKAVLGRLRTTWRPLLAIHLAYAALAVVLLAPLTGALVRLLIGLSGGTVLADQEIAYFLLTPLGAASLVLICGLLVAAVALEQASMMALCASRSSREGSAALDALAFALRRAARVLTFAIHLAARLLLFALPFVAAGAAAAWLLIGNYDVNYYLQVRPPAFWGAVTTIGLLLTALAVVILRRLAAWSLSFPLVLFLDIPPARSFSESERLTAGKQRLILQALLLWVLAALALGALALALVRALGGWILPPFFDSLPILVILLGGLAVLWFLANLLATAFNSGSFALLIVALAERLVPGFGAAERTQQVPPARIRGRRISAPRVAMLLLAGVMLAGLAGGLLFGGIEVRDDVLVAAHRGAAGKAPENTLASVRQAIEDRADWVEIDVQESADGEVVVIHDSDFMKLAGVDLKVWEATLTQISAIDVGSWFAPSFAGERVPTLRDVLDAARGKAGVLIELKYYGHDEDLERRVVEVVEAAGAASSVALMSLEYAGIQKIRALRPDWTIGLLSAVAVGDLTSLDADFLAVNTSMATPGFVRRAHKAGKRVFAWTLNDPVSMSRVMSFGVDGIITDEPEIARRVLEERASLSPVERLMIQAAVLFGKPIPPRTYRDSSP